MSAIVRGTTVVTRSMARNLAADAASTKKYEIKDQPDQKVLAMKLNGEYATVEYEKQGNVYELVHSSIPDAYQGKGLGKILAKNTLDYIANNNLRMRITCEFLMSYYSKNIDKYKKFYADV